MFLWYGFSSLSLFFPLGDQNPNFLFEKALIPLLIKGLIRWLSLSFGCVCCRPLPKDEVTAERLAVPDSDPEPAAEVKSPATAEAAAENASPAEAEAEWYAFLRV